MKSLDITFDQFKEKVYTLEDKMEEQGRLMDVLEEHLGLSFFDQLIDVADDDYIYSFLIVKVTDGLFKIPINILEERMPKIKIYIDDFTKVNKEDLDNLVEYQLDLKEELEHTDNMINLIESYLVSEN